MVPTTFETELIKKSLTLKISNDINNVVIKRSK